MIIEQFLPAFHYGDAIGNSTLSLHKYLLGKGIDSRIISLTIDENMRDKASFFKDYRENPESIKILHFAVPSELTDFFIKTKGKKVMVYHNITPARFFVGFSDEFVKFTNEGRNHLKRLKDSFDMSIADSEYNAQELRELSFGNVFVFPIMINFEEYSKPFNKPYYNLLNDERKNIIFVGRISPNKKIEDLIKVLFFYKKFISPSIRLIVAGNTATLPKYFYSVRDLASRFFLTSDDIVFTGHIPFDELLSVYKLGDIFLSMSEHEGFCLPLIESCCFQVPIIAYDAGAVSETMNEAGIIVKNKNYEYIAGLVDEVIFNKKLNSKLKNYEKKRVEKYFKDSNPEKFLLILNKL
jgi:glycosyltransferase involved in cell wall biosynthesis